MWIDMAEIQRWIMRSGDRTSDLDRISRASAFADRAFDVTGTRVPAGIHSDGENLVWNWQKPSSGSRRHTNSTLYEFVKLSAAPDKAIVDFARRYGVLGAIDEGSAPAYIPFKGERWRIAENTAEMILRRDDFTKRRVDDTDDRVDWYYFAVPHLGIMCVEEKTCPPALSEPLQLWRELSRNAAAIIRIAGELNFTPPLPGRPEDWKSLWVLDRLMNIGEHIRGPHRMSITDVRDARHWLQREINDWLRIGGASIRLLDVGSGGTRWQPQIQLGYREGEFALLGSLGLQLMLTAFGSETIYNCDGCGLPYLRTWKAPNPGCKNYCSDCGTECARRDANHRRKQKMVDARRLARKGFTAVEIAGRVHASPASIRRWTRKSTS